LNDQKKKTL